MRQRGSYKGGMSARGGGKIRMSEEAKGALGTGIVVFED